jgi:hypothetical protein
MATQEFYQVLDLIGSKPVQLAVGQNADGDTRYRLDVTYSFQGEERRRTWLTRTQLQMIHALLDRFLYEDQPDTATETSTVTGNGTEPPF